MTRNRKIKAIRAAAAVMSALMVTSLIPGYLFVDNQTSIVAYASTASSESSILTWSAVDLFATLESTDANLKLNGTWESATSTDDKTFDDGLSAIGTYVKSTGNKAKNDDGNCTGTIPNAGDYLEYKATSNGTLAIDVKVNKGKTFYVVDSDGEVVKAYTNSTDSSAFVTIQFNVVDGKTYYAYAAGSSAQYWQVTFEADEVVVDSDSLINTLETNIATNGFKLNGTGSWASATESYAGSDISLNSTNIAKASANGSLDVSLSYTAIVNGTVSFVTKVNKGKTLYVVDSEGNTVLTKTADSSISLSENVSFTVEAGKTYYAYVAGSKMQVWQAAFSPISQATQTAWSEVSTPVITSIEEDGMNLVVNFEGEVNSLTGADDLQVTLYYESDGTYYEVDTVTIKNDTTKSATFTPLWSGNYKAVVAAERSGETVKYSDEVYKLDYVLAVKDPVIESVISNGDGTVSIDWLNLEDANSYEVFVKESDSDEFRSVLTTSDADATFELLEGTYDIKIVATRSEDGYMATYTKTDVSVSANNDRTWNIATVGSAQETNAIITTESGETESINISSKDSAEEKVGLVENVTEIANTSGTIEIEGSSNGKISDGEEGFQYYYTTVNPDTENFTLTATFTITDTSLTPDNQTGFGIIACDMLGYNFWGTPDYVHKYFNSVSTQMYSSKGKFIGQRIITGYSSVDTTSYDGVTRTTTQNAASGVTADFTVGTTYTFTLSKTDDAWVSYVNGVEISNSDLSCLSVQEDGSITIGVFASRKVSVKISDITFTTSESNGVGEASKSDLETPSGRIYSTNISAVTDYEFIYSPTVSGTITVYNVDGTVSYTGHLDANEVLNTVVELTSATNTIKYEFTPDGEDVQALTSYDTLQGSITVSYKTIGNVNEILYVSADGKSTGAGTKEDPVDIQTAVNYAQPGQYILLLNGTYTGNTLKIARSNSGTEDAHIKLVAESVGGVIFDGLGINITGSYWDIYGIYVKNPSAVGIQVGGNYNTIEMCTVEGSSNTGIQISRTDGADREAGLSGLLWPSYNTIKNCESFDNCDSGRNDADGFAAKLTSGVGNVFYGCIAHNNIDDGWDLFAKTISGEIGEVKIINCVAYNNGWLTTDDTQASDYVYGEGNGFKLGGSYMKGGHSLINSVTYGNVGKGITSNSCPDCKIYNCTSYGNAIGDDSVYNVGLNTKASLLKEWVVSGLISITTNSTTADLVPFSLVTENNYIYDGTTSHNNKGVEVTDDWFESVDLTITPTRNEDGTIDMHGLLVLTSAAATNAGARLDTTSDEAKSLYPTFTSATDTDDTVADEKIIYEMLEGANQTLSRGESLTLRSAADFDKFDNLLIDEVEVDSANYTVVSGSTVVTVAAVYLDTLSDGEHSIEIVSTDGSATTVFTLLAADETEGDNSNATDDTSNTTATVASDETTVTIGEVAKDVAVASTSEVAADEVVVTTTGEVAADTTKTADTNPVMLFVILIVLAGLTGFTCTKKKYTR